MRLLTYNIHKGVGGADRRYRFERIIEVLQRQDPDVVCLQEVDRNARRSRHDDQPAILADKLGMRHALYQLNVPNGSGGYGNLMLSRYPFRHSHDVCLRLRRRKPRAAQVAVVETPEGPLHLVNWHLGLAEHERRWQVGRLLEHALFDGHAHLPTLVAGDYNDWRDKLGQHRFAPHGFEQVTAPTKQFRSFPAFFPLASLDKVFRKGDVRVRQASVVRDRLTKRASDHLPLVVDFHLG
jgi:endonuclease/exonuclease/phosphatase family metal-dependent hydrolase